MEMQRIQCIITEYQTSFLREKWFAGFIKGLKYSVHLIVRLLF